MQLTLADKNQDPSVMLIKTMVCSDNGQINFLILAKEQYLPPRVQDAVHKRQLNH